MSISIAGRAIGSLQAECLLRVQSPRRLVFVAAVEVSPLPPGQARIFIMFIRPLCRLFPPTAYSGIKPGSGQGFLSSPRHLPTPH